MIHRFLVSKGFAGITNWIWIAAIAALIALTFVVVAIAKNRDAALIETANASDRSTSSWCRGDRPLTYAAAPATEANDPTNGFDTDETVADIQVHNARLWAACKEEN